VIDAVDLSDDEKGENFPIDEKSVALNSSFGDFNFHPNQKEDQTIYSKAKKEKGKKKINPKANDEPVPHLEIPSQEDESNSVSDANNFPP